MTKQELRAYVTTLAPGEKLQLIQELTRMLERELVPAEPSVEAGPLERLVGSVEGPPDLAENHDRYAYGAR